MANEYILAVEDDEDILELIKYNLSRNGYDVEGVTSGEKAMKAIKKKTPDLLLLDLMLPGIDGLEICRQIKNSDKGPHLPVVMLTARGDEADIVTGLELGADDYITKPFSPRVLVARIKTVLRRIEKKVVEGEKEHDVIKIGDLIIHSGRHEVSIKGKLVDLTFTEFRILNLLASRAGWVFTRYQIVDAVHGEDYPVTERSVDVQIVGLRKKLGNMGKLIETVRGVGYRFKD